MGSARDVFLSAKNGNFSQTNSSQQNTAPASAGTVSHNNAGAKEVFAQAKRDYLGLPSMEDVQKNAGLLEGLAGSVETFGNGLYTEMQGRQGKYQNGAEFSTYADGQISAIDGYLEQANTQADFWTKNEKYANENSSNGTAGTDALNAAKEMQKYLAGVKTSLENEKSYWGQFSNEGSYLLSNQESINNGAFNQYYKDLKSRIAEAEKTSNAAMLEKLKAEKAVVDFQRQYLSYAYQSGIAQGVTKYAEEGRAAAENYARALAESIYYKSGEIESKHPGGTLLYKSQKDAEAAMLELYDRYGFDVDYELGEYLGEEHMTEEEENVYFGLLAKEGGEKAQEYMELLHQNSLDARYGAAKAKSMLEDGNGIENFLFTVGSGFLGSMRGVAQLFSSDALSPHPYELTTQELIAGSDGFAKIAYQTGNTVGNQIPALLLSAGGAGTAALLTMGVSAKGAAYAEALERGYSKTQANIYSGLVGASEVVVGKLLGGVGKISGFGEDALLGLTQKIGNTALRTVAQLGSVGALKSQRRKSRRSWNLPSKRLS